MQEQKVKRSLSIFLFCLICMSSSVNVSAYTLSEENNTGTTQVVAYIEAPSDSATPDEPDNNSTTPTQPDNSSTTSDESNTKDGSTVYTGSTRKLYILLAVLLFAALSIFILILTDKKGYTDKQQSAELLANK